MNTDPPPSETPTSETPAPVWPPAPSCKPPDAAPAARRTLTPLIWLDLALGLPVGFAGALLLYFAVGAVGNLVSPSPGTASTAGAELFVFAALDLAFCVLTIRRLPFFGVSLTLGALLVLLLASFMVWI